MKDLLNKLEDLIEELILITKSEQEFINGLKQIQVILEDFLNQDEGGNHGQAHSQEEK